MDEKQRIIQEIRALAESIAPGRLSRQMFQKSSSTSLRKIRYHFGTWNRALEAAGLEPNPPSVPVSGYKRISEDDLLAAIGDLWMKVGRNPTEDLMNAEGKYSTHPYRKRWGSFSAAVQLYVERFGVPNVEHAEPTQSQQMSNGKNAGFALVISKTHKSEKATTKKRPVEFGEPIDFRGLRYAPVNEQGVVYLFGMVSHDLGFLIESVRTDFPDCEGKRRIDLKGAKWQHVRIEFEYKSSRFAEAGHDPDGCDLIVCWIHDWKECPLEVLELKSVLPSVPKQ